jgi:hypothetical protein
VREIEKVRRSVALPAGCLDTASVDTAAVPPSVDASRTYLLCTALVAQRHLPASPAQRHLPQRGRAMLCSDGTGPMNAAPTAAPLLLEWHTGPPIADSVVREFAKPKRIEAAGTLSPPKAV